MPGVRPGPRDRARAALRGARRRPLPARAAAGHRLVGRAAGRRRGGDGAAARGGRRRRAIGGPAATRAAAGALLVAGGVLALAFAARAPRCGGPSCRRRWPAPAWASRCRRSPASCCPSTPPSRPRDLLVAPPRRHHRRARAARAGRRRADRRRGRDTRASRAPRSCSTPGCRRSTSSRWPARWSPTSTRSTRAAQLAGGARPRARRRRPRGPARRTTSSPRAPTRRSSPASRAPSRPPSRSAACSRCSPRSRSSRATGACSPPAPRPPCWRAARCSRGRRSRPSRSRIADPCQPARPARAPAGIDGAIQDVALTALDRAACRYGSSREELALALVDDGRARARTSASTGSTRAASAGCSAAVLGLLTSYP